MANKLAGKLLFLLKLVNIYFVVDALQFTTQPDDTSARDGADSVVLNCKVDDSSVEISWMKNNRSITVDYIKYTKIRRGLRIKPVEKSDAGVYHCLAGSALRSRDARLTIEYTCKNNFTIKSSGPIFRNGNATLTCNCPSIPTPTYKWQKDSKDINITYQSIVITSTDVGKYVCIVQSGKITVKSQPHSPPVFDCLPSRISFPPKDKIPFVPNKPLTLECVAKGDPKPVVTWKRKKNNSPLKDNQRIQVNDNGTVRFFPTKRSDAGEYTCSASNNCDRSMTYTTTLTLAETGSFTPIQDTLSRVNMTITIRCNPPNGAFPVIKKITWQMKDGSPLPNDSRFTVKDNTLRITQPKISDSNVYLCVGENIAGKVTVEAKVTVAVYPTAILNPIGQTVIEGSTLQLKCKFGGNPKPEISWEKDKKTLKENLRRNVINMKDSSLLNLINVTKKETGSYRCVARLEHITERTYEAKVVVKENIVLQKIASDKFDVGTTAELNCKLVAGYEPIDIRWSKELDERSLTHMKVEGFKLVIENIRMKDSGNYICYVNNSFSESSLTFHVNVYEYTKIVLKPSNVTVAKGENAWLHCNATGIPKPIIMWRKDNMKDEIKSVKGTRVYPNGTLMLSNISQKDKGWYTCMAGNPGVIITERAYVDIVNESNKNEGHSDNMGKIVGRIVGIAVGCVAATAAANIIFLVGLIIYCKGRRARLAKKKLLINGEDVPLKPTDNAENGESAKAAELNNAKEY
ncbi:protein sax-3-like isoform X3 [Xenia sp. Carnegie-2017]|uniref:protein sax-3-like isoform X3 n=1 Tax=Xenia sp. Carnegie-2017 TaxID=2897299 RepID=UPI001F04021A|nr:protein sax-3-like isoform X3 [Xenia sp. Carnegie-2017]